ncbi:unnamed protein product [Leptidea sinapis]|uniref:Regulatory protein zeste n=1 Tax=Leptidea sinapis TaxID=189913 RepID=A0A5E4Q8F3_9NEOP|nr:unnamed protein product [Leptidea sinapis]
MDKVKKRAPNYTENEKQNLLELVAKYKDIVDCKRTGSFYINKKQIAWAKIADEYNSFCTTGPRNMRTPKHFYNNIKHHARKVSAIENVEILIDITNQPTT